MSTKPNLKVSNADTDWLKKSVDYIKHYERSDFENIRLIGKGAFGNVFSASLQGTIVALKSFNNCELNTLKEIVNEV